MEKKDCFRLGRITSTHGIRGTLVCEIDSDEPQQYGSIGTVWIDMPGGLSPYAVQSCDLKTGQKAFLKLSGVEDLETAEPLRGCDLFLPLDMLPDPGTNRFYLHEAFGYDVHDSTHGHIGQFKGVMETPGHDLARVVEGEREILVPLVPEFLDRIDRDGRILYVTLPDGLWELYS